MSISEQLKQMKGKEAADEDSDEHYESLDDYTIDEDDESSKDDLDLD